jgi:hypothetical protein
LPNPSIQWISSPDIFSKSILNEKRKKNILNDQHKFAKQFESHIDGRERIDNRENCVLRLTFKGLETVSYNK